MINIGSISIGDYLACKEIEVDDYAKLDKKIIKVARIEFDYLNDKLYLINGIPFSELSPIYITEDWLKELSFTRDPSWNEWFQYPDKSGISIYRDDYQANMWVISSNIKIEFIHQLQNIMRL